jgi:hypothetical protein
LSSKEDQSLLANSPSENPAEEPREESAEREDGEPLPPSPKLALKSHLVAHEVLVKVTGAHPGKGPSERELFNEETTSILVCENGGVISLRAAVVPGQLLFLENAESKREVVGQVIRKRAHKPTSCYVELEFTEPAPGFWGVEFSAATALLPKDAKQREAADLVTSAQGTTDEPEQRAAAPDAGEVQALKREVEALREQLKQMQPPPLTPQPDLPVPPSVDPVSTAAIVLRNEPVIREVTETSTTSPVIFEPAHNPAPMVQEPFSAPLPAVEQMPVYRTQDIAVSLPKVKRFRRPTGNFTPAFRAGALRVGVLGGALLITMIGAAWYKHWTPWQSSSAKPRNDAPAPFFPSQVSTSPNTKSSPVEPHDPSASTYAPSNSSSGPSVNTQPPSVIASRIATSSSPSAPKPRGSRIFNASAAHGNGSNIVPDAEPFADEATHAAANDGFAPPKLISSVRPVASLHALNDFETGHVVIDAVVGTSGEVLSTRELAGPPSLRGPAASAVMQYRYEPATKRGRPVATHVRIVVRFEYEP